MMVVVAVAIVNISAEVVITIITMQFKLLIVQWYWTTVSQIATPNIDILQFMRIYDTVSA